MTYLSYLSQDHFCLLTLSRRIYIYICTQSRLNWRLERGCRALRLCINTERERERVGNGLFNTLVSMVFLLVGLTALGILVNFDCSSRVFKRFNHLY